MSYTTYSQLYNLDEVSFIGGTTYNLDFKLQNTSGSYVSLVGKTFTWQMSPYGSKSTISASKTGISLVDDDYIVRITLSSSDTQSLSGKYIHQISFVSDEVTNAAFESLFTQVLSGSSGSATVGIGQPSFPRYLTVASDDSGTTSGSVTIVGTDDNDDATNESILLNGIIRVSGSQIFKTITEIHYPAEVAGGETITIGGGSYLLSTTYVPAQGIIIISPKIGG